MQSLWLCDTAFLLVIYLWPCSLIVVMPVFDVAGMVWSEDLPGVETLKENIAAYFNVLQGFLLACHGSTIGAGPTLHKYITSSAKGVVDASFLLFKLAVPAYGM